jgi:hypothetical protein
MLTIPEYAAIKQRAISISFGHKDYVEHLRTVHFTLVAVSAGLIVVLLSSKSYSPSIARREIYEILELKQLWSSTWIEANGRTTSRWSLDDLKKLKSAAVMPHIVDSAFSPSLYVYTVQSIHHNLYRILLQ